MARLHSRRILLLHGTLLLAVMLTAYISVRAQYRTLSNRSIADVQSNLEMVTHAAADSVKQQMRLVVAELWDPNYATSAGMSESQSYLSAAVEIDRRTGNVLSRESGDGVTIEHALSQAAWLTKVLRPATALATVDGRWQLLIGVPMRGGQRTAIGLLSNAAIVSDLTSTANRDDPPAICLTDDSGRVLAASSGPGGTAWLQPTLDATLQERLNTTLKLGGGSSVGPGDNGIGDDTSTILSVRALEPISGVTWHVVAQRTDVHQAISKRLQPVFWQLISLSTLMVVATAIVMISTTVSLRRGSRHIERMRTQMLERDLKKARAIQLNWLPANIMRAPHLSIAAENRPALHISGDFYNWFELPAGEDDGTRKTVLVIGDVSGHGLPAAFLMATTQLLVRNTMPTVRDPGACLAEVNRQLCTLVYNGQFVTMMILVIDHELRAIEIASAGQGAPLLRRDGKVESMQIDPQLVAGVDPSVEYPTRRIRIRPGDMLLLYTDGAVESASTNGEQYGIERLGESIRSTGDDPQGVVTTALQGLMQFCGQNEIDDDLTLVAVQIAHDMAPHDVVQAPVDVLVN